MGGFAGAFDGAFWSQIGGFFWVTAVRFWVGLLTVVSFWVAEGLVAVDVFCWLLVMYSKHHSKFWIDSKKLKIIK